MGSPCRIPHVGLKLSENIPFTLIEKETDVIDFMTNEHQEGGKLRACMMALK